MKMSKRLRDMIARSQALVAPGAYDGLSARLIALGGFEAVYASGGAIARSTGIPDLGLMSLAEVVDRLTTMVDAVSIPIIADADTGYGNALNAQRTAKAFERAGVAALHLEDQQFPKRCGHYDDKAIVPAHEMTQKIRAVRDALSDDDFVIIARTDGLAVEGYERTIERAHQYMEAGADMIFVEAPTTVEEIEAVARDLPYPKLINMFKGGKTPFVPSERLAALGYRIVIVPSDLQRAAIKGMEIALEAIRSGKEDHPGYDAMVSFKEREARIGTTAYLEREARYAS
ncbi:isocitrate lyase/PEP mutase family protein [Bordetella sp. 02P26C-1]|uniref:isocitrate lyase/PEP mutase family protein n=1 Tax=Bordetella sp. 02P26C-1 TaxID=2683195 RepID=UPI00135223E9|nr:oxaloacetate decarboxylase [Bordetella sp. 02P26C-1]MVW77691.1 isocitrate lyase [Bordetella sp. 02P26C-1]